MTQSNNKAKNKTEKVIDKNENVVLINIGNNSIIRFGDEIKVGGRFTVSKDVAEKLLKENTRYKQA